MEAEKMFVEINSNNEKNSTIEIEATYISNTVNTPNEQTSNINTPNETDDKEKNGHVKNASNYFGSMDQDLLNHIVTKAVLHSKFITTRNGRYWLPELETMISEALQVIWRDNINLQKNIDKLVNEPNWQTNLRALVAIYCNVFLWIASWNMLTNNYNNEYYNYLYLSEYRYLIDLIYILAGLFSLIYNGTLYQTAGYNGSWRNKTFFAKHVWWKAYGCLFGQFAFTIGVWDMLYLVGYDTSDWTENNPYNFKFILKDLLLYIIGYIFVILTDSYWTNTCVMPPWYRPQMIQSNSSFFKHIKFTFYSIISLIGAACIWAGMYDFLLDYTNTNLWRELFYMSTGLLIFIASGSFVSNSLIWEGFEQYDTDNMHVKVYEKSYTKTKTLYILYIVRAWLALQGQIVHNAGAWMLFDIYVFPSYRFVRDLIFLVLGIIGLAWSRALLLNASITPFSIPFQPDSMAMIYNSGAKNTKHIKEKSAFINISRTHSDYVQEEQKIRKQTHGKRSSANF